MKSATSCEPPTTTLTHPSPLYCPSLMCDGVHPRISFSRGVIGRSPCCACLHQEAGISAQFLPPSLTLQSNMYIFPDFFGGVDMEGQYVFRQRWRPSWEDADVLICVSGKPSRQLWSGFWWIYMRRWDLVASLNSYMLIAILIKDETDSSGVILASLP